MIAVKLPAKFAGLYWVVLCAIVGITTLLLWQC
jgi:hypothetical protein